MAVTINASTTTGIELTPDTSGNLNLQSGGSTKIAVTSSGVAVTGALTVNGTAVVTAGGAGSFTTLAASGVATFSAGSASAPAITTSGDTNTGIFFQAADALGFATAGTEWFRIVGDGRMQSYTTDWALTTSGTNGIRCPSINTAGGTVAVFDSNGGLYKQASSARYKENIEPMVASDAQITAFINTTPSFWDYKVDTDSKAVLSIGNAGFIAEDLAALGINRYDKSVFTNYDADGLPDSNKDYAIIAMQHLVIQRHENMLQELKAIVDAQAERIAILENK
jgi:hypothetical protein